MRQFNAVFIDAIRLLRARVLFWVTLGISLFAGLLYLSIGFNESGFSVFFGLYSVESEYLVAGSRMAEQAYLGIFGMFIVNLWLSWIAVILALITCAPVFPEFMQEGSAGVVLSKPISRWKLFLYKYLAGLLFAAIQTAAFCLLVFVALRWRIGHWNPTVFWAVPLIVLMFSYIWSVMVLTGVKTRSVMASVLAALVFWCFAWLAKVVEEKAWMEAELGVSLGVAGPRMLSPEEQEKAREDLAMYSLPFKILPKTTDTVNLLQRWIVVKGDSGLSSSEIASLTMTGEPERDEEAEEGMRRHSPAWIIGSSLAFEAVILFLAGWIFCRRDY